MFVEVCLTVPIMLLTLYVLNKLASFKVRLLHFCALFMFSMPLIYLQMNDYGLMSLSFTFLLATWYTLLLDSPIIASVIMTTALNLELSLCLPFVHVFIVYSISNIIEMSPSA